MLDVIKTALEWAKDNECTRFPSGNGYKGEGFSAFEAVNKALSENNVTKPDGTVIQLNKGQFIKILNTNEMKEAGLTRFDGINDLRKARVSTGVDVLSMFGLTAAPKKHREPKAAKNEAVGSTQATQASQPVEAPTPVAAGAADDDFDSF